MTKEYLIERYGTLRYTIGTGLLGRLARPAVDRQRLPGRLPGDPADLLVPGRVGHGDAVPRLPPDAGLLRRPRRSGGRAWPGRPSRWPPSRATSRSRTPGSATRRSSTSSSRPTRCRGITGPGALRPDHQPGRRAVHDPGRGDQRVRPAPRVRLDRRRRRRSAAASRASRPTTSACSTAWARCAAARSRPPSSSTSTRRSAASASPTARSSRTASWPTGRRWPTPTAAG